MSRVRSFQNLTTSSLAGIYASVDDKDILDTDSPWDTGPERPVRRDPHMDEPLYMLLRDRCYPPARRRVYSISHQPGARSPLLTVAIPRFLARRGALLFFLGMGFAILITYFHKDQRHWSITLGYLAFWGTVGMAVGGLQPLFDSLWKTVFPEELEKRDDESKRVEEPKPTQEMRLSTHWDAAMRAVGTVMGIVYAFRHLIWTSSIQFSVALAVINPIFWWAVDRSKTGFIFSASAALIGSIFLLGSDLKVVPSPPTISTAILRNTTTNGVDFYLTLGGRASLEAAEEAIWMLSVLFCSSVCFGNVGRVLAADHSERVVPWDPMVKVRDL
ncbi:Insulin-induced protein [Escovopsis weberi]|uniref:Insulin-induced protein n=1 Tax=Escovopsis weberi TaxID=150374 RepID=A0A0M8MSY1_ESCWE|nr:Insulin-induced protein [Escovopsis weberi]